MNDSLRKFIVLTALVFTMLQIPSAGRAQYLGEVARVQSDDGSLNIRDGAATQFPVTGVLQNDDLVVVREISGNWVRITEAAGEGWVYAPMLSIQSVTVMKQIVANNPGASERAIKWSFQHFDGTEISFYGTRITDLSALSGLAELRKLNVMDTLDEGASGSVHLDLSTLAYLDRLEVLRLDTMHFGNPYDVSPLVNLTGLRQLSILFTELADVSQLAQLNGLEHLSLLRTGTADITSFSALTKLKSLDLSESAVSDLTPLAELTALETLDLSEISELTDVSPLANLDGLRQLDLRGSYNVDLSTLSHLTNLEIIGSGS